jgi:copper chaperone NosL
LALTLALAVAPPFGLAACGPAADPLAPPDIRYGEDVCAECGMIISEPRYAAGLVAEVGGRTEARAFDDIGDLFDHAARHPELSILRWYVHDHDSLAWLDAREATFVRSDTIASPMGHGLAAFADGAAARRLADATGGELLTFDALARAHGAGHTP